jgi:hypothetical protein
MIVANRSTLTEKILFNHAVKDMSQGQERKIHIIFCHLSTVRIAYIRKTTEKLGGGGGGGGIKI